MFLSNSVAAMVFDADAKYTKDNINYVFKEGLSIKDFEILDGGIKIDKAKYGFVLEGGTIDVSFYADETIGISSSVPQKLTFNIIDDGIKQYLNDGESVYIDTYNIGGSETVFIVEPSVIEDKNIIDYFADSTPIERQSWSNKKIIELEYSTTIDDDGIISGKNISVTNLGATIAALVILLLTLFWWLG